MNQEEVESQLSSMFDGELPAAECELLSRRIDRDERLRARWSRYALIGAAMRSEPVATARSGFAARVGAALDAAERGGAGRDGGVGGSARAARSHRRPGALNAALAAGLVAAVAGLSIALLRNAEVGLPATAVVAAASGAATAPATAPATDTRDVPGASAVLAAGSLVPRSAGQDAGHEPLSYVTPADHGADPTALRTELADYIVAHSEYSTPLMRRNLLSALVSGGDQVGASDATGVAGAPRARQGGADATTPSIVTSH